MLRLTNPPTTIVATDAQLRAAFASVVAASTSAPTTPAPAPDPRIDSLRHTLEEVQVATNAILSSQEIARRFEVVREELLSRVAEHEEATAAELADFAGAVASRIATLEALSFGTLLRLLVRRILGR